MYLVLSHFSIKALSNKAKYHSLPIYYSLYAVFLVTFPALIFLVFWSLAHLYFSVYLPEMLVNFAPYIKTVVVLAILFFCVIILRKRLVSSFKARHSVERIVTFALILASSVAVLTTLGIIVSLVFESYLFFQKVPFFDFIFGLEWSPQIALREDQVASEGKFGMLPIFAGTFLISLIAMCVAVPIGLMSAIYLSEYASHYVRAWAKPTLEILAGIPTVVYGFFAALSIAPIIRDTGSFLGLDVASESALVAGLVMGIMIIPFVSPYQTMSLTQFLLRYGRGLMVWAQPNQKLFGKLFCLQPYPE